MEDYIKVAMDYNIGLLLKNYSKNNSEFFINSLNQAILDYVLILDYVKGDNPDRELRIIFNSFENNANVVARKMVEIRIDYCKRRAKEATLLNRKIPKKDNYNYMMRYIPKDLYNGIKKIIKKYPNLYHKDKKTTIKDIIDRSVLFRISENDDLMDNPIYRELRIAHLLSDEKESKMSWVEVIDKMSIKQKVRWKDGN